MRLRLTRRSRAAVLLGATVLTLVALTPAATAAPTSGSASDVSFGPVIDRRTDDAQRYATRLGGTPQFYGQSIAYPIGKAERDQLDVAARAAAAQGADVLLELRPRTALGRTTSAQAADLAADLDTLSERGNTRFLVDFAPEMNGSWVTWGQQPEAFVAAYRRVAAAVHRDAKDSVMLWEPANGAGYPFGGARGEVKPASPRDTAQLDTNDDGRVTEADDPYEPYWPGDDAVDRVGLSVFWYGDPSRLGVDAVPPANWFRDSLNGTVGYVQPGRGRDFVSRYATGRNKPMFVESGALTTASAAGTDTGDAIVTAWIRQVFAAVADGTVDSVAWLELRRPEAEANGRVVDWRATIDPQVRTALRAGLTEAGVRLGPVPPVGGRSQASEAAAQAYAPPVAEAGGGGQADRVLGGIAVLAGMLVVAALVSRYRPTWRYPVAEDPDRGAVHMRDGRVDMLRGFVMAAVVIIHIGLAGPWSWFVDRTGAITGAEMFVLLSGVVLGALYPRLSAKLGEYAATSQMVQRAGKLYLKTLAVTLIVFFAAKIPGVDGTSVTTFTDRGTGPGGGDAAGRVYYMFGTAQHLMDYPPPSYAIKDLLLLRYGPWPMNIMGLFVILSLAVPACMWLVRRGMWWLLLAISWALFALNLIHPVTLFDAQFEGVFPLFAWQIAFTHGLVIGRYRGRIVAALRTTAGKAAIGGVVALYLIFLLVLRAGVDLPGVPVYRNLYESWYQRTNMDGGRLIDLVVFGVVVYAFLTALWKPLHATVGRFLEPIGQLSLRVFFLQVFAVFAIGNIPNLDPDSAWQGFVVQTVALAVIWAAVRPWNWRRRSAAPPDDSAPPPAERPTVTRRVTVSAG